MKNEDSDEFNQSFAFFFPFSSIFCFPFGMQQIYWLSKNTFCYIDIEKAPDFFCLRYNIVLVQKYKNACAFHFIEVISVESTPSESDKYKGSNHNNLGVLGWHPNQLSYLIRTSHSSGSNQLGQLFSHKTWHIYISQMLKIWEIMMGPGIDFHGEVSPWTVSA